MTYLILGATFVAIFLFAIRHFNKQQLKAKIVQLQSSWVNTKQEYFDFPRISNYANAVEGNEFHRLSDQTIEDIDFHRLFKFIDRTTSKVGQQYLFKKLVEPSREVDEHSEEFIHLFTNNQKLREEAQLELLKLTNSDAYYISSLLKAKLLTKPKWFGLLIVDLAVIACLILFSFKIPALLIVLAIPMTVNMFIHIWNKSNTIQFVRSVPQLNLLVNVANALSGKNESLRNQPVEESIADLKSFQRKTSLINFNLSWGVQGDLTQLGTYLLDLVKAFFLIEVFMLFRAIKELENKKASIQVLFSYVGNIDASISIASLRAGSLRTCQPIFTEAKKEFAVKNVYHPLIHDCVKNDLAINGKSVLITGSNMSGKSTFLRTFIINSILAQTIRTCFADEFITPILRQHSSIRIDDNLFEGKSYYFQEVSIMASLIAEVESPSQNLFVLDEVFKGTNAIERIAAAKSILSYLNRNSNIVIVSTHDIELADMLENEYDLYHFTETIENDQLHFDHKIKPGQLRTRNAIKLLELANYPADIIMEARQISSTIAALRTVN